MEPTEVKQVFDDLKSRKSTITDPELDQIYNNIIIMAQKYAKTNQLLGLKKLLFILDTIKKEHQLIKLGINTFVYKDAIESYIEDQSDTHIKIIELSNYEREIPDEIVQVVEQTKDIFDEMYVVYTDYTQKTSKRVDATRKEKDPILFGAFFDSKNRICVDRFYYLGDWIDEYCDLTLERMVNECNQKGVNILKSIDIPKTMDELKAVADSYKPNSNTVFYQSTISEKPSFFQRVKTFFKL